MDMSHYRINNGNTLSTVYTVLAAAKHPDNVTTFNEDGSIEILHALGGKTPTLYTPVTDAEAQQIIAANVARGERTRKLFGAVREALRAAQDVPAGKHEWEAGPGAESGVVASVHGDGVHVYYWHATTVGEDLAKLPGQDPWADGGARDATRTALAAFAAEHGCTVTEVQESHWRGFVVTAH